MLIEFTNQLIFGFEGPNLCFLGNQNDFKRLAKSILELTSGEVDNALDILSYDFIKYEGDLLEILFSSKKNMKNLGVLKSKRSLWFELDSRYWERIFKFFVLMSWEKSTYYLNFYEECLIDLDLKQEVNFICSSEF